MTTSEKPYEPVPDNLFHRSVAWWAPVLDLSERTIREAIRTGELGHVRVGDRVLISRKHVETWLASQERKPNTRK